MKQKTNVISEEQLPINRTQAFFRAFKNEYLTVLLVSVFTTLTAIPVFAVFFIALVQISNLVKADLTIRENILALYEARFWAYLWSVPASTIFAIGASGGFYVIRRLVWNQEVKFFADFSKGIKSNILHCEIVTVIFFAFAAGLSYGCDLLYLNYKLGNLYRMLLAVQAVALLFALAILLFEYCSIAVYEGSAFTHIKNGLHFALGALPSTTLIMLLTLAPSIIVVLFALLNVLPVTIIVSSFLALLGFGYAIILFTLHAHRVFDKAVNKEKFPQIYRKGLFDGEASQKQYDDENKRRY